MCGRLSVRYPGRLQYGGRCVRLRGWVMASWGMGRLVEPDPTAAWTHGGCFVKFVSRRP